MHRHLLTILVLLGFPAMLAAEQLAAVSTRDQKIIRRWSVTGEPRGVALGADSTIYVGLAQPQAVIAVDPKSGEIKNRIVLDSAEIASTKELVTLRMNRDRTRLYIANGSDESATILSLPDLGVLREITMEGEAIRDALPDPAGKFLYLLGRDVHVFDINGERELKKLSVEDSMAIAASSDGATLAILGTYDFGSTRATVVALYNTLDNFAELGVEPLQTDSVVGAALFAAGDRALVAAGRDYLYEKPLAKREVKTMRSSNGQMRMDIDFGDLVSSDRVCLPEESGPQILTLGATAQDVLYAERRCSASAAFSGSRRLVSPASLYGVSAWALAYDAANHTLVATDKAGYLTVYKVPRAVVAK